MGTIAGLFPPGTDLCQIPSGTPPSGQVPNFDDPGLKAVTISISVVLTTITVVISLGRLHANLRKPSWTDWDLLVFVLLAMVLNIAVTVVMIICKPIPNASHAVLVVKYFRHIWDMPLCWINGQFEQEALNSLSLFFSKTATLMLFRRIFAISRAMNIAIWIGTVFCFATYASSIVITSYYSAPHFGSTWDQVVAEIYGPSVFLLYWSIAQGSASTLLDVYIFILPLPVLAGLHLSTKRKIQIIAIFCVGLLGVAAGIISLVYRVKATQKSVSDATYNAGIPLLNNLVEMDIAVIICSAPAFTNFLRASVLDSRFFYVSPGEVGTG
ncbi:hypothetical protein GQX73_g9811 [Xylaria multiplex]|uniref:Rhodopsin domain-containing protein n=1 Tax=Xylaria multiplex TaxID=323545 RepID=A0A7C8ITX3_9PEZI|nr:hypothetical protein GQX73_g9811 [Xylaria multiplex]